MTSYKVYKEISITKDTHMLIFQQFSKNGVLIDFMLW